MTKPEMTLSKPIVVGCQITNTCNLDCKQCYTRCEKEPPATDLSFEQWTRLIDDLHENEVIHLYFEGGDCLLRPDFLDILRYAQKRFLLWFRTHATTVTTALATELASIGIGRVVVDIFGTDAAMHDYLTGTAGSFERTLRGAWLLRDAGVPVIPATIVNNLNLPHLQWYVDFAAELGAEEVGLLRLYPIGVARDNWTELTPRPVDITNAIAGLRETNGVRIMNGYHPYDANCCWVNAHVTSTGDSIGCPYLRGMVNYGNVLSEPFMQTWDHPLYRQLRTQTIDNDCPECTHNRMRSPGGCRSSAFTHAGSWAATDPFCPNMDNGIDVRYLPMASS